MMFLVNLVPMDLGGRSISKLPWENLKVVCVSGDEEVWFLKKQKKQKKPACTFLLNHTYIHTNFITKIMVIVFTEYGLGCQDLKHI